MKFFDKNWEGKNYRFYALRDQGNLWIHFEGQTWLWSESQSAQKTQKKSNKKKELILSELPGRIQKIFVKKGDKVKKGQNLLILSAMKIEYSFKAEGEGRAEEIFCSEGDVVKSGAKLIKINYLGLNKA